MSEDTYDINAETNEWFEWPASDLDIDDEAFAEAIASGREFHEAA